MRFDFKKLKEHSNMRVSRYLKSRGDKKTSLDGIN